MKLTWILVLVLGGFFTSAYFAFFRNRPKLVKHKRLEITKQGLGAQFNFHAAKNPSKKMDALIDDLNWIIKNDYHRDIRVKKLMHQDMRSLVEISTNMDRLERVDAVAQEVYDNALNTISNRASNLRHSKDQVIRDQILMLGEMIEGNGK